MEPCNTGSKYILELILRLLFNHLQGLTWQRSSVYHWSPPLEVLTVSQDDCGSLDVLQKLSSLIETIESTVLFYSSVNMLYFTACITHSLANQHARPWSDHLEQFRVQCLARGHFGIRAGGGWDQTANPVITGRPCLSAEYLECEYNKVLLALLWFPIGLSAHIFLNTTLRVIRAHM